MELESAIAEHHWSNVECRDAVRTYNRRAVSELPALCEGRGIRQLLTAMNAPAEHIDEVVVRQPGFVEALPKLLKKIGQSLSRVEAGDYGFCDETGEPIGLARLLARPTATLSLEAQQRREMKQKMFGD